MPRKKSHCLAAKSLTSEGVCTPATRNPVEKLPVKLLPQSPLWNLAEAKQLVWAALNIWSDHGVNCLPRTICYACFCIEQESETWIKKLLYVTLLGTWIFELRVYFFQPLLVTNLSGTPLPYDSHKHWLSQLSNGKRIEVLSPISTKHFVIGWNICSIFSN